ncbi:MAG TPA: ADOP family duplicated permease, partial [Gemmatimonadaceae bacterium]|nr:ADOP family duplicated permease [Gemmatimonadaceae bacterium]
MRYAFRMLVRNRGFTIVVVLTLAVGIGSSSAIYSLINAIVLRPLPVADPQELYIARANKAEQLFSHPVVEHTAKLLDSRAQVAAQSSTESVLIAARGGGIGAGPPEPAQLQLVAGDFFGTLRQRAQIGRLLGPDDNRTLGQHPVAVISDQYWRRRFDRSARVLDTELMINGQSMAIVGVAAPGFFGATVDTQTPDVWAPAAMQAALRFAGGYDRSGGDLQKPWPPQPEIAWLRVMVRVPAGGAPAAAEAMTLALDRESPPGRRDAGAVPVTLLPGSGGFSPMRGELTTPLTVLLLAVGLLLAMACANIASLLLARATNRDREMAIRLSMGAGRGRLIRQLLTESLLLASIGGGLGLLLASWGSTALLTFLIRGELGTGLDVRPDWRVVSLTFATSMATALAFGLLPALRGTRVPLAETLKAQTRSVIGAAGHGGRLPVGKILIAGQMSFAVLLLLVAALFLRSLQALVHVDVGYDRDSILVARIDPRSSGYTVSDLPALYTRVFENLARLPGVVAVSASTTLFSGRNRGVFSIEGYTPGPDEQMTTLKEWVTSDYFRTVGLAVKQGRGFGPEDSATSRRVSIINETMAQRYFRNQNPIGKRLSWGGSNFDSDGFEIVGVVEDARYNNLRDESLNMAYTLVIQNERFAENVQVRVGSNPTALTNAVRNALRESEPRLSVGTIETLNSRIARSIGVDRLLGWVTTAFGAAALGLACLGLYGTISYAVKRRTAELGIRIALGADSVAVQWLIVREALLLVLAGGAVGLLFAFLAARSIGGLLYATAPSDPVSYGTAAGLLVVVSAVAAYIPAWRASRLDPLAALRHE